MRVALPFVLLAGLVSAQDLSYLDALKETHRISPVEVARLENALLSDPHDLSTRARLMSHYFQHALSQPRMAHVLWVIEHHPASKLAGSPLAGATRRDLLNTRGDYETARLLWLKQADSHRTDPAVLANAGRFFAAEEPQRAEPLLLRAWELDRADKRRLALLAGFYAKAIADCDFRIEAPADGSPCPDTGWLDGLKIQLANTAPVQLTEAVAENLSRIARSNDGRGLWRDPGFLQRLRLRLAKP